MYEGTVSPNFMGDLSESAPVGRRYQPRRSISAPRRTDRHMSDGASFGGTSCDARYPSPVSRTGPLSNRLRTRGAEVVFRGKKTFREEAVTGRLHAGRDPGRQVSPRFADPIRGGHRRRALRWKGGSRTVAGDGDIERIRGGGKRAPEALRRRDGGRGPSTSGCLGAAASGCSGRTAPARPPRCA